METIGLHFNEGSPLQMNFNVLDNNLKSGRYIILDHVLKCDWVVITLSK